MGPRNCLDGFEEEKNVLSPNGIRTLDRPGCSKKYICINKIYHKQVAIIPEYKTLLNVSAITYNHLQGVSILKDMGRIFVQLFQLQIVKSKMSVCY